MDDTPRNLIRLAELFAEHSGKALTTLSRLSTLSGLTFRRLAAGNGITTRRAAAALQWFSDEWPQDLPWPPDIPRPPPSPDSPAAQPPAPIDDPLAAVEAEWELMDRAERDMDWPTAERHRERMVRAATTLGADGRIKSSAAALKALDVPRHVYDYVLRRFADGKPDAAKTPRDPASATGKTYWLLVTSGDVRFSRRRLPEAS